VSILLAALRKTAGPEGPEDRAKRLSTAPVWLGVAAAVSLAGSFAAVLTFSTSVLSSSAQEAAGGSLSVLAVVLVTGMIFWMRKTARTLSKQLKGEVSRALTLGAGALTLTAFLATGREGLETTLFLWTAAKASGQTVAPVIGAAAGLAIAITLCALMYRQAVKLNIGVFFNRTAIGLIIIAAGVLSYGLGDLQDAGMAPGQSWLAFDLTAHIDPSSWWMSIITGLTELSPKMTVLQVTAWLAYLAVVITMFLQAGRAPREAPAQPATPEAPKSGRWERLAGNRPWTTGAALVGVPVVIAAAVITALPAAPAGAPAVTVTSSSCAGDFKAAKAGSQTFTVHNSTGQAGEIRLVNSVGAIAGEIETLGPATSSTLTATLGGGSYSFLCLMGRQAPRSSAPVQVTAARTENGPAGPTAVKPVTVADLTPPNDQYEKYAAGRLSALAGEITKLRAALGRGDLGTAKRIYVTAQLQWESVGASYDSFGDLGTAVDGLPEGLRGGVRDPAFTGLHRLEYGLWHGQSAGQLEAAAATLASDVARVRANLASDDLAGDPTNLPIRIHEIGEDALRDHLSGMDDEGSGSAYAMTDADLKTTRVLLGYVAPLLEARSPGLVKTLNGQMDGLAAALDAAKANGKWRSLDDTPLTARQDVTGALGSLLETLSSVPTLLEVPPTH